MRIVLIGMSGSGKTTFGKYIANLMEVPFIDTDEEICKKYGDISAIFESAGEKVFRDFEEHEMMLATQNENCVIALGGGAVLNENAMKAIKKGSLVVYLYCEADFLLKRLESDNTRPLLLGDDKKQKIEEMLRKRGELYLNYSNIVLNEGGILEGRNILDSEPEIQLGALYLELLKAFEKRVYSKYSG